MITRHYAQATKGEDDVFNQAEVIVVETYQHDDGEWEEGDIVDSAEWLSIVDDVTSIRVFEPADAILENMGWQRLSQHDWVDVAYGYVASVKPLALF
jgi:DNA-binding MltR family transcriptional regulator